MTPPAPRFDCCAILLAAGQGVRFGGPKMLADLRGQPLVTYPMRVLAEARAEGLISRIVAVIPAGDSRLAALLDRLGAELVHQPDPTRPLSDSLRLGLAAAAGATSAMVVLGDQPLLRLDTIRLLAGTAAANPESIVRPVYADAPAIPGHPVVIPARWWHMGGIGAGFREAAATGVPHLTVPVPGRNPDVDTVADLRTLHDLPG